MVGQTLSHYRIVRPLGAGGMGEVFLAEDTKLGRQVALKVLARDSAHDPDRRARFEREARAVAALNHPGIVTLYSVEEDQGLLFITMELVDGTTLVDQIPPGGMPLDQLLKIAIPLTDAVGTAHQRGITHRDLKPANVMISHDGRVKVLDFGLAKQQTDASFQGETAMGLTAHATAEGKILGTVAYMSPEQAQSKPVDPRSDIFSLGVVLFEMATGEQPFKGDSNVSVLSSVIKDTPPLVTDLRPELPRDIGRIVRRCLIKDPEERYQSAKDLRNDLKALKEDSDSGELTRRSAVPVTPPSGVTAPVAGTTSSPSRRRWLRQGIVATLVVACALIAAWWSSAPSPPRVTATRQITTDGAKKSRAVTDGSRLYFGVSNIQTMAGGGAALAQVSVSGGDTVQLAPLSPELFDIDPSGTELLVMKISGTTYGDLAIVPVLGGTWRPVGTIRANYPYLEGGTGLESAPSAAWTADKSHIIYVKDSEIRLAGSDGSESRTLLTSIGVPFGPRISPDGLSLRYSVRDPNATDSTLWEADADGGNPHLLLPGWNGAQNPCCGVWTPDGRYFLFEASGNLWARAEAPSLFRRRRVDPVQLTFGPLRFSGVTPSRDGKHLFVTGDLEKGRLARYDSASKQFVEYLGGISAEGVVLSPDGRWVAYTSYPDGTLWRSRLDGSERLQLTFRPMTATLPRWSPDGSQLAFYAGTAESSRIYMVPAAGGAPRRATSGKAPEWDPTWSPDGRQLAFSGAPWRQSGAKQAILMLDLASGQVTQLPRSEGLYSPRWSPDGRYILALSSDSNRMVLFDVAAQKWTDLVPHGNWFAWPTWLPDSKTVQYWEGEGDIRRVRIADGRIELVTNVNKLHIAQSVNGEWLGATPDGAPLVLLDAGTHDIYALDWEAP
jgi:serine/threonine protein kinase/Tol biopolymer transport system component